MQRRLQQELGREPTFEEVALEMEFLEPDDARIVRSWLRVGEAGSTVKSHGD